MYHFSFLLKLKKLAFQKFQNNFISHNNYQIFVFNCSTVLELTKFAEKNNFFWFHDFSCPHVSPLCFVEDVVVVEVADVGTELQGDEGNGDIMTTWVQKFRKV